MSPDFFVTFLSLRPRSANEAVFHSALPISVEMASLDLVPQELREKALEALAAAASEPVYLRQRRLRDLLHEARATRGEILDGGVDDLATEIEDSLLRSSEPRIGQSVAPKDLPPA